MKLEQLFYWIVWIFSIIYALWKFSESCLGTLYTLNPHDFEKGWRILNRMKDNSDVEWIILTATFKKYWVLLVLQVFCSQLMMRSKRCRKVLPLFYAYYSLMCLVAIIGVKATVFFFLYVTVIFIVHLRGRKMPCYALTLLTLMCLNNSYFARFKESFLEGEKETFLFEVGMAWLMTRSLSFVVDRIEGGLTRSRFKLFDFAFVVSYCFYLPAVFTGPILSYDHFHSQMISEEQPITLKGFLLNVRQLLYYIAWYFIFELLLHFVYSSAVQYYPDAVMTFNGWSLCGLGYALPMMFYTKYLVIYGIAGSTAQLEGFYFPPPPKCISCIHLSSYLWRHFDRGLYLWILRYLYHPLIGGNRTILRKTFALVVSFGFVCLWHGMDKPICMWTVLNFTLVASEMLMQLILSTKIGKIFERFSVLSQKRLQAAFAMPHFMMMCMSCTFFLSNWDIGMLLIQRILFGGLFPLVPLAFIMYCGCHVSIDTRNRVTITSLL